MRVEVRRRGLTLRTEEGYVSWYRRFVKFHGLRHPSGMGRVEVEAFLSHLAMDRKVSASTQSQALNALVFLFREVLKQPFEGVEAVRARRPHRLPVVLDREEVRRLLAEVPEGTPRCLVGLLYGCGLRVSEGLRLRVKDVDFGNGLVWVRQARARRTGASRCRRGWRTASGVKWPTEAVGNR
ncbi:phage integrase N-terminal SAM-like domain-containing protein [Haloferula sargassicola]|uniref:Tyrosine recombinase XerC n=1 Tax=Haloferula sargassicola TaxID=490096 RepID=A0ABP9UP41_9BACT